MKHIPFKTTDNPFLFVGYPKVGNTWIQVMISYLMDPYAMINGTMQIPENTMFSHCMPLFHKESYSNMLIIIPGKLPEKHVILLVRHPGDILVSLYMHIIYRQSPYIYNGTIDNMVYDDTYGINKILKYYNWWQKHRKIPALIYLIRYEDLLADTFKTLKAIIKAIKLPTSRQNVYDAVKFGSFGNMQLMEKTNHLGWPTLFHH